MKQALTLLIIVSFLAQTFSRSLIIVDYYTNTAAFAKNCENKARPKLHCNGKCQMMKKLKEEEKKDQQNPERKVDKNEVLSSRSFFSTINILDHRLQSVFNLYAEAALSGRPRSFFHPPGA